jgi:hypothetical protein
VRLLFCHCVFPGGYIYIEYPNCDSVCFSRYICYFCLCSIATVQKWQTGSCEKRIFHVVSAWQTDVYCFFQCVQVWFPVDLLWIVAYPLSTCVFLLGSVSVDSLWKCIWSCSDLPAACLPSAATWYEVHSQEQCQHTTTLLEPQHTTGKRGVVVVVYLTTLFQQLRLYSVDF